MAKITLEDIWKRTNKIDRMIVSALFLGMMTLIVGFVRGLQTDKQVEVEFISASDNREPVKSFVVDIEGAVMAPGVYELPSGSRIKDLLVKAGGLSEKADREYCEKNINLAEAIKDGQKYYIPYFKDTPGNGGYIEAKVEDKKININTASMAELDTLWGIGEARAEKIVKNRPYGRLEDLISKGVMSQQMLEKNKDKLTVY